MRRPQTVGTGLVDADNKSVFGEEGIEKENWWCL
jgi:hypothetical protein